MMMASNVLPPGLASWMLLPYFPQVLWMVHCEGAEAGGVTGD